MARSRRRDSTPVYKNPVVIVVASICSVVMLSCFGFCGLGFYLVKKEDKQLRAQLAEAEADWDAGRKEQAVNSYKSILDRNSLAVPDESERPLVYARIIDHETQRGNNESAKLYIRKALDKKVDLTRVNKGQTLVAEVRAEKAAEQRQKTEEQRKTYVSNGLELQEKTVEGLYDNQGFTITGVVINRRKSAVRSVTIFYVLYDESNTRVGTATATTPSLGPGASWHFRAAGPHTNARKFRLSELTCE